MSDRIGEITARLKAYKEIDELSDFARHGNEQERFDAEVKWMKAYGAFCRGAEEDIPFLLARLERLEAALKQARLILDHIVYVGEDDVENSIAAIDAALEAQP